MRELCPRAGEGRPRRTASDHVLHDEHLRPGWHSIVEVDQIFRQQADAAGGDIRTDGPRLERAMDAVEEVTPVAIQIECAWGCVARIGGAGALASVLS